MSEPVEVRPTNWKGPLTLGIAVAVLVAMYVSQHTEPSFSSTIAPPMLHGPGRLPGGIGNLGGGNRLHLSPAQMQAIRGMHPRPLGPTMSAAPQAPSPPAVPAP